MKSWAFVAVLLITSCGGNPSSPSGEAADFTWTVNDVSFRSSSNGRGAATFGNTFQFAAADCSRHANLNIQIRQPTASVTTYQVDGGLINATWTPDASSGAAANV